MQKLLRYREIDLLRTLAIILMIIYHVAFDLWYFYGWPINVLSNRWTVIRFFCVALFLLLAGVSFYIASSHKNNIFQYSVKRSFFILACALIISATTYFSDPDTYIRFGILHCIGVTIIFLPFLIKLKWWNLLIFLILNAANLSIKILPGLSPLLIPLGITPDGFQTLDYYPLIPWSGFMILGLPLGILVKKYLKRKTYGPFLKTITFPGRHSLLVYLIHQPIILLLLLIAFNY